MEFLKFFLPLAFIGFSCSQARSPIEKKANTVQRFEQTSLGEVLDLNNQRIDLDSTNKQAVVIVFASETCATCFEEVQYWKTEFSQNHYPNNIYFIHYLLGGYIDDAIHWKPDNNITWPVVYNTRDELFQKYCSAIITPCFLIQNNVTKEITQTYNVLKKEDIERITGTWNY